MLFADTCTEKVDVVFALDITQCLDEDWEDCEALTQLVNFVIHLVRSFSITDDHFHLGVIIYARSISTEISLKKSYTREELIEEIASIEYSSSFKRDRRYTHDAMKDVKKMFDDDGREDASHICVLVTTGKSYRDPGTAEDYGDVHIFVLGVGVDPDDDDEAVAEFHGLAYDEDDLFYPATYDQLVIDYLHPVYDEICVEEGRYSCWHFVQTFER